MPQTDARIEKDTTLLPYDKAVNVAIQQNDRPIHNY